MKRGFSISALLTFGAVEDCPVHCSTSGLYPLEATSISPSHSPHTHLQPPPHPTPPPVPRPAVTPNVPGKQRTKLSPTENHCCKGNLNVIMCIKRPHKLCSLGTIIFETLCFYSCVLEEYEITCVQRVGRWYSQYILFYCLHGSCLMRKDRDSLRKPRKGPQYRSLPNIKKDPMRNFDRNGLSISSCLKIDRQFPKDTESIT